MAKEVKEGKTDNSKWEDEDIEIIEEQIEQMRLTQKWEFEAGKLRAMQKEVMNIRG